MWLLLQSLCLTIPIVIAAETPSSSDSEIVSPDRNEKVGLFNVVRFQNTACQSTSAIAGGNTFRTGTCFTASECAATNGGSPQGNCASGFGVCCVISVSCGSTINRNCTYFQNPGFPAAFANPVACMTTVQKCASDICFFRLDFENFEIAGTADNLETNGGACQDTFDVNGVQANAPAFPQICGTNTGQHMIIDVGNAPTASAMLAFAFMNAVMANRMFDIKVTQISCTDPNRPPNNCVQYFTGNTGRISSYNFFGGENHLANQNYGNCIRRNDGMCCIQYLPCADQPNSFTLDGTLKKAAAKSLVDSSCTQDFVTIPNSGSMCKGPIVRNNRYCGNVFGPNKSIKNVAICTCSPPFMLSVKTDNLAEKNSVNNKVNRGYCFDYMQIPC